ncbi:MAG: hypothetical protein K8R88_03965 [Armatimonadetes bacterium]|nr:hypothetical protein [Armatimonadota bacterium]
MKSLIAMFLMVIGGIGFARDLDSAGPTDWKIKVKPSADLAHPALLITGDNRIVDFKHARYDSVGKDIPPDQRKEYSRG